MCGNSGSGVFQVLLLLMSSLCHSQGDHSSFAVLHASIVDHPSPIPHPPQAITRMTEEVSREHPDKSITVEFMPLDLASLQSVKRFTEEYKQKGLPLHLLINNAGISYNLYG